jgi:O-antigen ligase
LILTRSRGGWVGFCISIIVIFWLAKRAHNVKLQIFGKPLLFISVAVFILIFRFSHILGPRLLEPTEEELKTAEVRIPLMKVAYNIIKANPVFGVGVGRYWRNMASYDDTEEKVANRFHDRVHNIYLFIASELGLLGLLGFLWIAFSIYRVGGALVKSIDPLAATIAVGILGGVSSFFVHGMVDSPIALSKVIILWFLSGLLMGLKRLDIECNSGNKY